MGLTFKCSIIRDKYAMKKIIGLCLVLFALNMLGDDVIPIWDFKLDGGDFQTIESVGTRRFRALARVPQKLEWGPGRLGGKALYFKNNVNGKERPVSTLEIPASEHYDFSKPFTAMCWFMPGLDLNCRLQYTIFGNAPTDYGPGFRLVYGWGALVAPLGNGAPKSGRGLFIPSSRLRIILGTWNHVALRYDGVVLSIFFNGVEVGAAERQIFPIEKPRFFNVGSYNGYAYGFNGAISDFKLFDQPLSSEQILRIARNISWD